MNNTTPVDILLIEDSPSDAQLVLEAFEEHRIKNRVQIVNDGEAAMAYLNKEAPWEAAPTPDLILLDLNLPRKDGREVLQEIKANPKLCAIPVIVMTTSSAEKDVAKCYSLGASSYIVKPPNFDEFLEVMKVLGDYWFQVVKLPRHLGGGKNNC